jgi:hypothetical protein
VETFETINKETKGNDFYGYYIEYKKPTTLLMTEFYFAFPGVHDLYETEPINQSGEYQPWIQVLAKYIGSTTKFIFSFKKRSAFSFVSNDKSMLL